MNDPDEMTLADLQDGAEDDAENPLRSPALRMPPRKPAGKTKAPRRKGDKSGSHTQTQVNLRADEDEVERWTLAAQRSKIDRNSFLRSAANELADKILGDE